MPAPPATARSTGRPLWPWAALLAALLVVGALRWRWLDLPLERDEGEYAYVGQLLLQGVPPYQLAYTTKFPGVHLAYAGIMGLFGQTVAAIHAGLLLVTSLSTGLVFLLGRRLVGAAGAAAAAWTFAVLSASPSLLGLAGHATHFVVLFSLLGLLALLDLPARPSPGRVLAAGCAFGLATLMKQHGAFLALFGFGALLELAFRQRALGWPAHFKRLAWFVAGALLPLGLTALWLWQAGVWGQFVFWTFTYAGKYVAILPVSTAPSTFAAVFPSVAGPGWGLWLLAGAGFILLWFDSQLCARGLWFTGLLVLSFAAVCPGFYFRDHYFLMLVPPVALLTGVVVRQALLWGNQGEWGPMLVWVGLGAFGLAVAGCALANRAVWFAPHPAAASHATYGGEVFPELEAVADYIRTHSHPTDRIAVLGSEPQIYFLAQRRAVTGNIYTYPLTEPQPFALEMQRAMIRDLETARPVFVVFVDVFNSWFPRPESPRLIFEWWPAYAQAHYQLVGLVDVSAAGHAQFFWDDQARAAQRIQPLGVMLYRRTLAAENPAP